MTRTPNWLDRSLGVDDPAGAADAPPGQYADNVHYDIPLRGAPVPGPGLGVME